MKLSSLAALMLLSSVILGCASYNYTDAPPSMGMMYSKYAYIGYDGNIKPIEEVGIVTTDGLVKIASVDGIPAGSLITLKDKGLYSGGRVQLHLLAGKHTLTFSYHDDRGGGSISWSTSNVTKEINISKGQVVHFIASTDGRKWDATARDGGSAIKTITSDFNGLLSKSRQQ